MKIQIHADKLTDSPYAESNKNAFLFDDEVALDQFSLELRHGHAGAYLISGYRGSGKTSFINRLQEKMSDVIFVELNIAKTVSYPILVKRVIRQLFLQYQAYCDRTNSTPGEFMDEFQLLYDRTFNDIVNIGLQSFKVEKKKENQQKFDIQKLITSIWKLAGPIIISLLSVIAMAAQIAPFYLLFGSLSVALIWGAMTGWTITKTETMSVVQGSDTTRKSLYDDEIAEHHLFQMLQKLNGAGNKMVIVFDELDKLSEDKQVRDMVNDIKPMLLSGYASFLVVAGQALYYDLERSTFLDDNVISTLFARTFHVAFLKDSTLQKFCLGLFKDDYDKRNNLATDFFDSLIIQSGRNPRKLVNLIRGYVGWSDNEAFVMLHEGNGERYSWLSKVHQEVAYFVDNSLASRDYKRVRQDFFIAQTFIWLNKMLTFDSVSFKQSHIWSEKAYDEKYPAPWVADLETIWRTLLETLINARLLQSVQPDPEDTLEFSWIYRVIPEPKNNSAGGEEEEEEEEESSDPDEITEHLVPAENDIIDESNRVTNDLGQQSRFLLDFVQFETYLKSIMAAERPDWENPRSSFTSLLEVMAQQGILDKAWHKSSVVSMVSKMRNTVVHGAASGGLDQSEITRAYGQLSQLWSEVNEQYTFYVFSRMKGSGQPERTTEGGFDILGRMMEKRVALDVKTFRDSRLDPRAIVQAVDKYDNYTSKIGEDLYYGMLVFQQNLSTTNHQDEIYFKERIDEMDVEIRKRLILKFIDMSNVPEMRHQVKSAIKEIVKSGDDQPD